MKTPFSLAFDLSKKTPVKALKAAYGSALLVLCCLTLASHVILDKQIQSNEDNAAIIHTGGLLRTSSQRIVLLSRTLVSMEGLTERENYRNLLRHEIYRMKTAHEALLNGSEKLGLPARRLSPELEELYHKEPFAIDRKISDFLSEASALARAADSELSTDNPHMRYIRREVTGNNLLADLSVLSKQLQIESDQSLERLRSIETVVMLTQLALLLLTALFGFYPMAARVQRQIDELNIRNSSLERKVAERTAVVESREAQLRVSEQLAVLDPLTEVLNRRGLQKVLSDKSGSQGLKEMAVMIVDLDNFKSVNDHYSHAAGDAVLKNVAGVLRRCLAESGHVCRIGGDEFIVLMPSTSPDRALAAAERVRKAIAEVQVPELGPRAPHISASIGMVSLRNSDMSVDELLRLTHSVLYRSKSAGKNRVTYETRTGAATA
ncbi:MAG: hypothetical protein MOGMAGMI_01119 [Candidatus Omnitrophica bacterium]|nr:hypothetical protein [Candidatus Omnitrophota bacterium]